VTSESYEIASESYEVTSKSYEITSESYEVTSDWYEVASECSYIYLHDSLNAVVSAVSKIHYLWIVHNMRQHSNSMEQIIKSIWTAVSGKMCTDSNIDRPLGHCS
jgi:hypothetical protein